MMETKNAVIKCTFLGYENHGILTAYIYVDYEYSSQGFGGYNLKGYTFDYIDQILSTLEKKSWEDLPGMPCRVVADHDRIFKIGHFLKEKWFDPSQVAKKDC